MLNDLAEAIRRWTEKKPFPHIHACPQGLYKARTGQIVAQTGPDQETMLPIPGHLPRTKEAPVQDIAPTAPAAGTEPTRSPEEEARDILATAAKNQAEDGPNTRRAAVRACKYLKSDGQPI